jgi:hypothetical protein
MLLLCSDDCYKTVMLRIEFLYLDPLAFDGFSFDCFEQFIT